MERENHGQTAPGEHSASPPADRLCSPALARLAPTAPAACLPAFTSPVSLGPGGARSQENRCFFPSDDLSGEARALPLIMGPTAGSQCSNRSGRADYTDPIRDSRHSGNLSRPDHCLTPLQPGETDPFLGQACFSERFFLSLLLDRTSYPRSFFSFSFSSLHFSSR